MSKGRILCSLTAKFIFIILNCNNTASVLYGECNYHICINRKWQVEARCLDIKHRLRSVHHRQLLRVQERGLLRSAGQMLLPYGVRVDGSSPGLGRVLHQTRRQQPQPRQSSVNTTHCLARRSAAGHNSNTRSWTAAVCGWPGGRSPAPCPAGVDQQGIPLPGELALRQTCILVPASQMPAHGHDHVRQLQESGRSVIMLQCRVFPHIGQRPGVQAGSRTCGR